jgi:uncharacterized protein (TIGR02145 family)
MKKISLILSAVVMTAMMLSSCGGVASKEVTIGKQVWMTQNLNVDKFRNGDPIPEAKTDEEWSKAGENGEPAWCYYNNNPDNGDRYGKLYNWYAVNDPRGLAPEGWKIPSDEEWSRLADFLGGESVAGTKMKSTDFWADYGGKSGNGTNESGFSGLPGGNRYNDGTFDNFGELGYWWSYTEINSTNAWYRYLYYNNGYVYRTNVNKENGFSVRCLRD